MSPLRRILDSGFAMYVEAMVFLCALWAAVLGVALIFAYTLDYIW